MAEVIAILFTSPLPVALVILGTICIILAIIGQIPPIQLDPKRSTVLGVFGTTLIGLAIFAAWLLVPPTPSEPGPTPLVGTSPQPPSTLEPSISTPTEIKPVLSQVTSQQGVQIQDRGTILIGVNQAGFPPFSLRNGNNYSGFEIELAQEIVQRLFGKSIVIEWIPLSISEWMEAVQSGRVDFLIRNISHTVEREAEVAFTSNYFNAGTRLMVRRNEGHTGIESLGGKTIVVFDDFTASSSVIQQAADNVGVRVNIQIVNSYDEALATFESGQVDALASDWETHLFTVKQNRDIYQSVGPVLTSNPFAIIVSLDDSVFRDEVDSVLLSIIEDGTWQAIYDRWISEPPPWTIEDMLNAPPINR